MARAAPLLCIALAACEPNWCDSKVAFAYDPDHTLNAFPDDYFTRDDPASVTGLRVNVAEAAPAWLAATPETMQPLYSDLSTLDGFGTSASMLLSFSAPAGEFAQDEIALYDLGAKKAERVPIAASGSDDGFRVMVEPLRPLRPATQHALVVTRQHNAPDGRCIAPSPLLRSLLTGGGPTRLRPRYRAFLAATGLSAGEVSAVTLFTTQSIDNESRAIASDIEAQPLAWSAPPVCGAPSGGVHTCTARFTAGDYRVNERVVLPPAPVHYELTARVWLPASAPKPWPLIIFGHGLTYDKDSGATLGGLVAELGMATVAIDAPKHGEHPTAPSGGATMTEALYGFLALDPVAQTFDALAFRDHWREATYDQLQLIRILRTSGDLDGDGAPDIDTSRIAYYGVSLGGTNIEPLALTDAFGVAVLPLAGGRVVSVLDLAPAFLPLKEAILPEGASPTTLAPLFPLLQTLIDRGDPANYAAALQARSTQLLTQMAMNDQIMPVDCTAILARALGVRHAPPVLLELGLEDLPALPAPGPAIFQFDRMTLSDATVPVPATHTDLARSAESWYQARHFLDSWLRGGQGEVVDPYAALGTPPL